MDGRVKALLRQIDAAPEWSVKLSRRNHWKVYRRGRLVTILPQTPSDNRGVLNARAALRRAGLP